MLSRFDLFFELGTDHLVFSGKGGLFSTAETRNLLYACLTSVSSVKYI